MDIPLEGYVLITAAFAWLFGVVGAVLIKLNQGRRNGRRKLRQ